MDSCGCVVAVYHPPQLKMDASLKSGAPSLGAEARICDMPRLGVAPSLGSAQIGQQGDPRLGTGICQASAERRASAEARHHAEPRGRTISRHRAGTEARLQTVLTWGRKKGSGESYIPSQRPETPECGSRGLHSPRKAYPFHAKPVHAKPARKPVCPPVQFSYKKGEGSDLPNVAPPTAHQGHHSRCRVPAAGVNGRSLSTVYTETVCLGPSLHFSCVPHVHNRVRCEARTVYSPTPTEHSGMRTP